MTYRRVLVAMAAGADPRGVRDAVRCAAPGCDALVLVAVGAGADGAALARLADELADVAAHVEVHAVPHASELASIVAASATDLLVVGPGPMAVARHAADTGRRLGVAVLWALGGATPERAGRHLLCVARGPRGLGAIGVFLRDHTTAADRVTAVPLSVPIARDDVPALLEVAGVRARVELLEPSVRLLAHIIDRAAGARVDLAVVTHAPPRVVLERLARRGLPILVLPPSAPGVASRRGALDVSDLVDIAGQLRGRAELRAAVGRPTPLHDQELAFVADGRIVARAIADEGLIALADPPDASSFGLYRLAGSSAEDPLGAVECGVAVLRRETRPLVLYDAAATERDLVGMRDVVAATQAAPVAVRLRPVHDFELVRARMRAVGLMPPRVVDAAAVLDEGDALDVPASADPVRLLRVAARLRAAGYAVARPEAAARAAAPATGDPLAVRLEEMTGAPRLAGNRIAIELDNVVAREALLGAIERSRRRVHLQVYIVADDDVARQVETALAAAAARGVEVRVLVDSLYALHGSLGTTNPVLERLAARPGVEVRVFRPLTGVPSLEGLKQRDHRKLVVVDNELALVGGRNLAREYYTSFHEVAVSPATPWRLVPWLDAGATVEGPAVAALERAFLAAWADAGGAAFEVDEPPPAGDVSARVVVHLGLRDAHGLEAYLALIDTARSHLYVVNGFPLLLELQHALLRALRRGVRVRALVGHVLPGYGEGATFGGSMAGPRAIATELVLSRLDPIVAAGGECHELVVRDVVGWDPELGTVRPFVHAKLVSADGAACAVGSANLDVTAGYWENELLLVVEDRAVAAGVEARLDRLLAASPRVDREDPAWRRLAARRAWLRHWPGWIG